MSRQTDVVLSYMEGFRSGDHERILSCLTDDVTWYIAGHTTTTGKDAFDAEIENPDFEGTPTLTEDRVVEEGDTVVVVGQGRGTHKVDGPFRFAFCTVFTFESDLIGRVESYIVPLAA